jgi:hypothetical protein
MVANKDSQFKRDNSVNSDKNLGLEGFSKRGNQSQHDSQSNRHNKNGKFDTALGNSGGNFNRGNKAQSLGRVPTKNAFGGD